MLQRNHNKTTRMLQCSKNATMQPKHYDTIKLLQSSKIATLQPTCHKAINLLQCSYNATNSSQPNNCMKWLLLWCIIVLLVMTFYIECFYDMTKAYISCFFYVSKNSSMSSLSSSVKTTSHLLVQIMIIKVTYYCPLSFSLIFRSVVSMFSSQTFVQNMLGSTWTLWTLTSRNTQWEVRVITSPLLSNVRHRAMMTPASPQALCVPRLWSRYSNFRLRLQHLEAFGSGVKRNFWSLRNFWPVIVCRLFCFSEKRNKVWQLLFWCVLCKLKHFG